MFDGVDIAYVHVRPLTARVWELRRNVSANDACYLALAESLDAPLLTTDARLPGAANLRRQVIVVRQALVAASGVHDGEAA